MDGYKNLKYNSKPITSLTREVGLNLQDIVRLPLVSLVIINWNYAEYIGQTIDSIKGQDYPELEVIIVDNNSTDSSLSVIAEHIVGDERFRIIKNEKNLGQLGAFLDIFDQIKGDFITIVDSDDILFPNFVSLHIQAHLAAPHNLVLTSSNVVEMNAKGRFLTGAYQSFSGNQEPILKGLRSPSKVPRVSTVNGEQYLKLAKSLRVYKPTIHFIWGPGTSNMYRKSVLKLVCFKPKKPVWIRPLDNFINLFSVLFGYSGLIDQPLSAYRLHTANFFSARESFNPQYNGLVGAWNKNDDYLVENMSVILSRAGFYEPIMEERYWPAVDFLSTAFMEPSGKLTSNDKVLVVFSKNYRILSKVFGEAELLKYLRRRLKPGDLHWVIRRAHNGKLPLRIRIDLIRRGGSPARNVAGRARRWLNNAVLRRRLPADQFYNPPWYPQIIHDEPNYKEELHSEALAETKEELVVQSPQSKMDSVAENYAAQFGLGPVALLSTKPPIFLTAISFKEYLGIAPAFGRKYGNISAGFMIYPNWFIDIKASEQIIKAARAHKEKYPRHELVFMCNAAAERDFLLKGGLDAHLLNHNLMVSEKQYRPLKNRHKSFDAIYNARFDPLKRHELAGSIERMAYVTYDDPANTIETRSLQKKRMDSILQQHPNHTLINSLHGGLPVRLHPREVNTALNQASVGLCLSAIEGGNYASVEYFLAGLPVVSTPSTGGRDYYFDPDYTAVTDPTPEAIRDAVNLLKARNISPAHIRERTLAKMQPQREQFLKLIDNLSRRLGGKPHERDYKVWPYHSSSELTKLVNYSEYLGRYEAIRSRRTAKKSYK